MINLCFRIHFAGTESATMFAGFMNGAVQAGRRAAVEVLYDLRPQLVNSHDLREHKPIPKVIKHKSSFKRTVARWTVYIGITTIVLYSVKKVYQKCST